MSKTTKWKPTPPANDDELADMLRKVVGAEKGLPWTVRDSADQRFKDRIERLGFKTVEDDDHWFWTLRPQGGRSPRPCYTRKSGQKPTVCRIMLATYLEMNLPAGNARDAAHLCPNDQCVRPAGRHSAPLEKAFHRKFDVQRDEGASKPTYELALPNTVSYWEPDDETP